MRRGLCRELVVPAQLFWLCFYSIHSCPDTESTALPLQANLPQAQTRVTAPGHGFTAALHSLSFNLCFCSQADESVGTLGMLLQVHLLQKFDPIPVLFLASQPP